MCQSFRPAADLRDVPAKITGGLLDEVDVCRIGKMSNSFTFSSLRNFLSSHIVMFVYKFGLGVLPEFRRRNAVNLNSNLILYGFSFYKTKLEYYFAK